MPSVCVNTIRNLVVIALLLAIVPNATLAQDGIQLSPKGTVASALLGAEVGLAVPSLFGVEELWPYLVAPAVGAGAGVVLGLLVVDDSGMSPKLATTLLAAGSALLIPSLVWAVSASVYEPSEDEIAGKALSPRLSAARAGTGLLRFSPAGTFVATPAVAISPGTAREPGSVAVSVLSGRFF